MKRTNLTIASLLLLAGCAHEGEFIAEDAPNSCDGKGYTFVIIHYSDSSLVVLPIINVRAGKELQYRLLPKLSKGDPINYKDSMVTITGVTAPDGSWMNASGTFRDTDGVLRVCVPAEPGEQNYKYEVRVDGVGVLDPRAEVQR